MTAVETFLDDTPGEARGVVLRDGRFEHLLIQREDDIAQHRLGARSVGRVVEIAATLKGAFVDLGAEGPSGFLPLRGNDRPAAGEKLTVEVSAEPRERKGPTLRLLGPGEGAARLLEPGPSLEETLAALAPGATPTRGAPAIQAGWDAAEEAGRIREQFSDTGLDMAVERTRALVAVDLDLESRRGLASGAPARDRANRQGLREAARAIRLRRWGGLVAIDLIGVGHDGDRITTAARQAFGTDPEIVYGPINRFGVLQLSLPWRRTPIEERLKGEGGTPDARLRALDGVRHLRFSLLSDTTSARITLRCAPEEAAIAGPLVARLGPRAHLASDPAARPGAAVCEAM